MEYESIDDHRRHGSTQTDKIVICIICSSSLSTSGVMYIKVMTEECDVIKNCVAEPVIEGGNPDICTF